MHGLGVKSVWKTMQEREDEGKMGRRDDAYRDLKALRKALGEE